MDMVEIFLKSPNVPTRYILAVQKLVNVCVQGPSTSANECILPMLIRFMHWPGIKFCVWRLHAYCSNMMPLYDTYCAVMSVGSWSF
jgi:hypothetical protein